MLEGGGTETTTVTEIQRIKFAKNLWNLSFSSFATLIGYPLPAIFRAPPKEGESYTPWVSEKTKSYVEEYSIPNIRAILEEAVVLGLFSFLFLQHQY